MRIQKHRMQADRGVQHGVLTADGGQAIPARMDRGRHDHIMYAAGLCGGKYLLPIGIEAGRIHVGVAVNQWWQVGCGIRCAQ